MTQVEMPPTSDRTYPGAHGVKSSDGAVGEVHAEDTTRATATSQTRFITSLLPPSAYHQLRGTECETLIDLFPNGSQVLVVRESSGAVVGCWALMPVYHAEGLWIAPAHRGRGRVARRLLEGMRHLCQSLGIATVATSSVSASVDRLLTHLGAMELPGRHFVFKV